MLKWIKSKCHRDCDDPIKNDPDLVLRALTAEVQDLRKRVEMLEKAIVKITITEHQPKESKIEFKPAPKKVGRPKKK